MAMGHLQKNFENKTNNYTIFFLFFLLVNPPTVGVGSGLKGNMFNKR
jgi:hypothetical protein